jgi:hypothetical protein
LLLVPSSQPCIKSLNASHVEALTNSLFVGKNIPPTVWRTCSTRQLRIDFPDQLLEPIDQFPVHERFAIAVASGLSAQRKTTPHTQLRLVIQTAIWLRFDRSSLARMCCTWFCAVRSER